MLFLLRSIMLTLLFILFRTQLLSQVELRKKKQEPDQVPHIEKSGKSGSGSQHDIDISLTEASHITYSQFGALHVQTESYCPLLDLV